MLNQQSATKHWNRFKKIAAHYGLPFEALMMYVGMTCDEGAKLTPAGVDAAARDFNKSLVLAALRNRTRQEAI